MCVSFATSLTRSNSEYVRYDSRRTGLIQGPVDTDPGKIAQLLVHLARVDRDSLVCLTWLFTRCPSTKIITTFSGPAVIRQKIAKCARMDVRVVVSISVCEAGDHVLVAAVATIHTTVIVIPKVMAPEHRFTVSRSNRATPENNAKRSAD